MAATDNNANILWAKASRLERAGDIDGAIDIFEALYANNSSSIVVANNLASLITTYRDDAESLERAWSIARRLRGNRGVGNCAGAQRCFNRLQRALSGTCQVGAAVFEVRQRRLRKHRTGDGAFVRGRVDDDGHPLANDDRSQ